MAFSVAQMVWLANIQENSEAYARGMRSMHIEQSAALQRLERLAIRLEEAVPDEQN